MLAFSLDLADARSALESARVAGASVARLDRIAAACGVAWGVSWTGALQVVSADAAEACGDAGVCGTGLV